YEEAVRVDRMVMEAVSEFDDRRLSDSLSSRVCEACGGGPIVSAMIAARTLGADRAEVLAYANSGDVTGDRSQVVGYMAAAFFKGNGEN
ncbi:MAG: AmmeMemoRadiSam system protein B, partial [Candidatus Latescibacterota bacterium]